MLNPVFRREVRTVLRTWKTFIAIMSYVLCLTVVAALALLVAFGNQVYRGFDPQSSTVLYVVISAFQLGLILLIVPALTGGAISNERERQTLDLMLVTKMSTLSIITGKLTASLLVVALMVVASLPVYGVIIYYGAVSVVHLMTMALYFLLIAAMTGGIAIFFSSVFKRTVVAIIMTYFVLIFLSLGTMAGVVVVSGLMGSFWGFSLPYNVVYGVIGTNPFWGFISALDSQLGTSTTQNFLDSVTWRWSNTTGTAMPFIELPLWVINTVFSGLAAMILVAWSSYIIQPGRRSGKYK